MEQHPRVALHRSADVADQHERPPLDLPRARRPPSSSPPYRALCGTIRRRSIARPWRARTQRRVWRCPASHDRSANARRASSISASVNSAKSFVREISRSPDIIAATRWTGSASAAPPSLAPSSCRRNIDLRGPNPALFAHRAQIAGRPFAWRPPPERAKRIVEKDEILWTMDEQRAQRDVDVGAPSDVDELERSGDVDHAACGHGKSGGVQHLAEVKKVVEKEGHLHACTAVQQILNLFAAERLQIFLVLEQDAERVLDRFGVQFLSIERDQRRHPVERLGDAGGLYRSAVRSSCTNAVDLRGQPRRRAGHLAL